MSQENVKVVRRLYEAARGRRRTRGCSTTEVECRRHRAGGPMRGRRVAGRRDARHADWLELCDEFTYDVEELVDAGDAGGRRSCATAGSGQAERHRGRPNPLASSDRPRRKDLRVGGTTPTAPRPSKPWGCRSRRCRRRTWRSCGATTRPMPKTGLIRGWSTGSDEIDHRPEKERRIDDPGPICGKNAMRKHIRDWIDTFDDFWFEAVELIDAGRKRWSWLSDSSGRAS